MRRAFREYRVRSWPVRSALRMRGSSLSISKSALMSVIAASCCAEESFESSSKKPITDDTADETASDMMDSACEAKESSRKLKMRFKRRRAEGGSALVSWRSCGRATSAAHRVCGICGSSTAVMMMTDCCLYCCVGESPGPPLPQRSCGKTVTFRAFRVVGLRTEKWFKLGRKVE